MIDKDLFLYDLAVVAIMKCEGPYLKEWLDYHLAAGVDHFYLYDNDSPDNQAEVAKPYVEAGLVDYFPFPGKAMQVPAYRDAHARFKFQCRYMAFIDLDEFIYPKFNKVDGRGYSIIEVVDEILSHNPNAAGLAIHWHMFDSNGQKTADYSRNVLERFIHCATNIAPVVKTIANPRRIDSFHSTAVHIMRYFKGFLGLDENLNIVKTFNPTPATAEKIVINHYQCKSLEEYLVKIKRGDAVFPDKEIRTLESFKKQQFIEKSLFDDSILKYRDARAKVYQPPKPPSKEGLIEALKRNLSTNTYAGKMETFLTCRAVSNYLGEKALEVESLKAIIRVLETPLSVADKGLFDKERPNLLKLPYPVVEELRNLDI